MPRNLRAKLFQSLLAARRHAQLDAGARELHRALPSNAAGGPGHDGNLSVETVFPTSHPVSPRRWFPLLLYEGAFGIGSLGYNPAQPARVAPRIRASPSRASKRWSALEDSKYMRSTPAASNRG